MSGTNATAVDATERARKRRIRRAIALAVALSALAAWQVAIAQPPAGDAPPTPATGQPTAAPKAQLPPGHPPIDQKMDPKRREQLRQLLEQRRQQRGQQPDAAPAAPAEKPPKPKAPRDEHGHCLGQGPDDRPQDINLFHGWLGSKHELGEGSEAWSKAVAPPLEKGTKDWWIWRLTPYPYRYDNHDDHCDRANQPVPLLANIINLAALVAILMRFGRKPLAEALKGRKHRIMSEFDKAAEIKKSAKRRLGEYEDQLEHLDDMLDGLREQYAAEGRHEEQRVRDEAAERRARLLGDAEFRVSQENKSARDELSREALESALAAAEELIQRSVSAADHQRLADEYLEDIATSLAEQRRGGRGASS